MNIEYIEKNTDMKIEYHDTIASTNERAKEIAEEFIEYQNRKIVEEFIEHQNRKIVEEFIEHQNRKIPEDFSQCQTDKVKNENYQNLNFDFEKTQVVISENQTKGKGTKGRIWYSNHGENILMTLIFYPQNSIKELQGITHSIAKMIQSSIQDLYDVSLDIKLPNDLLLNGKKICGILTESSIQNKTVNYLLIGIGFNVNQENFLEDIKDTATSLKKENSELEFSREEIIVKIINRVKSLIR